MKPKVKTGGLLILLVLSIVGFFCRMLVYTIMDEVGLTFLIDLFPATWIPYVGMHMLLDL